MSGNETTVHENSTSESLLKVYLRLRNTKTGLTTPDVYYVDPDDPGSLVATAPENSETHKNSHRNHTLSVQKFKFSKIFVPSTSQAELFESTALPLLDECLNLENNALLFTYGVTASGKTHTVQGPRNDAGLLPRSLDLIFNSLGSHIKPRSMFCPHLHSDVCKMTEKLQNQREQLKQRILYPPNTTQDLDITGMTDPNSTRCTVGSMVESTACENTSYQITDNVMVQVSNEENVQYSVWVSYLELYNENIYDLLHPPPEQGEIKPRDRPTLRLGEDHNMSVYVKGATQLEVCSFAEANRALIYGQRNRKKAATSMNQNSSRSHAIFKITVIATNTISQQSKSSQITFVDLAGSERYGKTNAAGVRLKEAGNINTSLLTLGKCISSLKHNSRLRPRQVSQAQIVPFRESKLTRLFKNFLSGEGLITMMVCVNPHRDFFDESIHALKFSALATEALLLPRPSNQQTVVPTGENKMSEQDLQHIRYEIKQEVLSEVNEKIKRLRKDHDEELEVQKERERRYYEGIEAALQQYYATVIEELKEKVRAARAKNEGYADSKEKEETISTLQKQCRELSEELKQKKSEHQLFKTDIDQQLFQTKLELKTTQQLYNDGNQEKERFVISLSEKEAEIKRMFQDLEEATKLSTFWEKECNDIKAANARQIEKLQCELKESGAIKHRLEAEVSEKTDIIEKITKQSLEHGQSKEHEELAELREQLEEERRTLAQTSLENTQLQSDVRALRTEMEEMKSRTQQDKKEISLLKDNCTEYTTLISNLKTQLQTLQKVLSSQESKENKENKENEPDSLRNRLLAAQEQLQEKSKLISELQEELSDIVRNKSLQFDTLICNKEKECEELQATLTRKEEIISNMNNRLQDLEGISNGQKQKILELQDLASVQKEHLSSVECGAKEEVEKLKLQIQQLQEGKSENSTLITENTAELERQVNKLRVEGELNKQEADRVKVELAAVQRKLTDELKKYKDTLEAKDIELKNWYEEKEKAVKLISNKKEKEISALEKVLEDKDKLIKNLEQGTVAAITAAEPVSVTTSEEYIRLSQESTRKLTEMADMVLQMETERDDIRTEFDNYKSELDQAISLKEVQFTEIRSKLANSETLNKKLEARSVELEETVARLKQEMESVEVKRKKQLSAEVRETERESLQSTRSSSRINKTRSRTSSHNQSRRSSTTRRSGASLTNNRTSGRRPVVKTASRRTSQVLINKTLNTTRSKRSRIQTVVEDSPSSDTVATPETVGVKRKATLKGLKDMLTGSSPRQAKRGKAAPVEISESDSDFATPTQTQPKRGKRKLHKSQISTPELIPPPDRPGLKDVVPETPDTETKLTRSRTRLIQQHLSGHSLRKTRSRNTKL